MNSRQDCKFRAANLQRIHDLPASYRRVMATRTRVKTPRNTYRLEPVSRFSEPKVKEVIEDVLDQNLHGHTYEAVFCKEMSKKLSDVIKQRVKFLGFTRYKFICIVHMGQVHNQGMRIGSRCLWDQKFDNVAEGFFRNGDLFAVATVFWFVLRIDNSTTKL
ncbi:hypothetical protein OS493_037673 [Desmophyllum pertusum]|uniref:Tctex1 domain-containing protein 2 n=1 Tax=Desmophyllum pertusum TaxID=174260 RepID=A0A9W9Z6E4_9CNID|nr:hypothetical protein OS493_037673 [Desmophyllum pertusum]